MPFAHKDRKKRKQTDTRLSTYTHPRTLFPNIIGPPRIPGLLHIVVDAIQQGALVDHQVVEVLEHAVEVLDVGGAAPSLRNETPFEKIEKRRKMK